METQEVIESQIKQNVIFLRNDYIYDVKGKTAVICSFANIHSLHTMNSAKLDVRSGFNDQRS